MIFYYQLLSISDIIVRRYIIGLVLVLPVESQFVSSIYFNLSLTKGLFSIILIEQYSVTLA